MDPSGDFIVKPCTQAELDFYEDTVAQHADFAALIPTFMGTLQLGKSKQLEDTIKAAQRTDSLPVALPTATNSDKDADNARPISQVARSMGKPLDTKRTIPLGI